MPDANRPSGPGKPIRERRDAVEEQEEIDELDAGRAADEPADASPIDPTRSARHAERDAHTPSDRDKAGPRDAG